MEKQLYERERERDRERGFQVIAIAMTGHLRPTLYNHRTPPGPSDCLWEWLFPPSPLLFFISIDIFLPPPFPPRNTGVELIRCSAALFTGCMLIMYNWVMYACVHLALWISYVCMRKFSCITFRSLIHACMYINYACNFIFYLSVASQGLVVRRVLTEPKLQSL